MLARWVASVRAPYHLAILAIVRETLVCDASLPDQVCVYVPVSRWGWVATESLVQKDLPVRRTISETYTIPGLTMSGLGLRSAIWYESGTDKDIYVNTCSAKARYRLRSYSAETSNIKGDQMLCVSQTLGWVDLYCYALGS